MFTVRRLGSHAREISIRKPHRRGRDAVDAAPPQLFELSLSQWGDRRPAQCFDLCARPGGEFHTDHALLADRSGGDDPAQSHGRRFALREYPWAGSDQYLRLRVFRRHGIPELGPPRDCRCVGSAPVRNSGAEHLRGSEFGPPDISDGQSSSFLFPPSANCSRSCWRSCSIRRNPASSVHHSK